MSCCIVTGDHLGNSDFAIPLMSYCFGEFPPRLDAYISIEFATSYSCNGMHEEDGITCTVHFTDLAMNMVSVHDESS